MTSPPSFTNRLRSGSGSGSVSSTYSRSSFSSGVPPKQLRHRYHSRSKSSLPAPIVLPFPTLPVRPISRDGSRAGSRAGSPIRRRSDGVMSAGESSVNRQRGQSLSAESSYDGLAGSAREQLGSGVRRGTHDGILISQGSGSGRSTPTPRGMTGQDGTALSGGRSTPVTRFVLPHHHHAQGAASSSAINRTNEYLSASPSGGNRPRSSTGPTSAPAFSSPSDPIAATTGGASASPRPIPARGPSSVISFDAGTPSPLSRGSNSNPNADAGPSALNVRPSTQATSSPASSHIYSSNTLERPSLSSTGSISQASHQARLQPIGAVFPHNPSSFLNESVARRPGKPIQTSNITDVADQAHSPQPVAVPITPLPPVQPLQDHLYRSFSNGECADVRLWVGKWGVGWLVHKVVLIQTSFFHSLFLGGFSEMTMSARYSSRKGKQRDDGDGDYWVGEDVELIFDDPNITRAAFEICLSRLYSPHPRLVFPAFLLPIPSNPLTPAFYSSADVNLHDSAQTVAPNTQQASPHLLLSLLATSIYLSHSPLLNEVLSIILRTIGPGTVGRYLGFAVGYGLGEEEWEGQADETAKGLEHVGRKIARSTTQSTLSSRNYQGPEHAGSPRSPGWTKTESTLDDSVVSSTDHRGSTDSVSSTGRPEEEVKVGSHTKSSSMTLAQGDLTRTASDASTIRHRQSSQADTRTTPSAFSMTHDATTESRPGQNDSAQSIDHSIMPHYYGFASDKIGEACVCWLARWGVDILANEIEHFYEYELPNVTTSNPDTPEFSGQHGEDTQKWSEWRIFRHRGLPARFILALLSSDTFFVKCEMARYNAARAVLDMRRAGWEAEFDERQRRPGVRTHSHAEGSISQTGKGKAREVHDNEEGMEEDEWEEWEEDETDLARVFSDGTYYSHMSFEDLSYIASDIDPTTGAPYAPLSVLQSAHWAAADLRTRISSQTSSGETGSNQGEVSDLGISTNTSDILASLTRQTRKITPRSRVISPQNRSQTPPISYANSTSSSSLVASRSLGHTGGNETVYHPVPGDDTYRLGAGGLLFLSANATTASQLPCIPGMPDLAPRTGPSDTASMEEAGKKRSQHPLDPPQNEATFFGLQTGARSTSQLSHSLGSPAFSAARPHLYRELGSGTGGGGGERWTRIQPFRFSVEFWGVENLAEKERLYSQTHFYAGSWWNVYVQTIRKKDKGVQLGIYLHRQSLAEKVPNASAPPHAAAAPTGPPSGRLTDENSQGTGLARMNTEGEIWEGTGTRVDSHHLDHSLRGRDARTGSTSVIESVPRNSRDDYERQRAVQRASEGDVGRLTRNEMPRGNLGDPLHYYSTHNGSDGALSNPPASGPQSNRSVGLSRSLDASSTGIGGAPTSASGSRDRNHLNAGVHANLGNAIHRSADGNEDRFTRGRLPFPLSSGLNGRAANTRVSTIPTNPLQASQTVQTSLVSAARGGPAAGVTSSSNNNDDASANRDSAGNLVGEESYRDTRRVTKAYFSISCASALGTALIRFCSSPDNFTLSQSWGWKSSALRSEEYVAASSTSHAAASATASNAGPSMAAQPGTAESLASGVLGWVGEVPREGVNLSLRATVLVGIV